MRASTLRRVRQQQVSRVFLKPCRFAIIFVEWLGCAGPYQTATGPRCSSQPPMPNPQPGLGLGGEPHRLDM